jgi:polyferredoxin
VGAAGAVLPAALAADRGQAGGAVRPAGAQFYLFGLTFWPQDFVYLALLLITAGLSLFFFTALAGRLWCGFACPQTVWTEVFIWLERVIEGDRQKRMKLDASPWNAEKIMRK